MCGWLPNAHAGAGLSCNNVQQAARMADYAAFFLMGELIEYAAGKEIFLTPREDCIFLRSRIVKEVARLGGDVSPFVSVSTLASLKEKFPKE